MLVGLLLGPPGNLGSHVTTWSLSLHGLMESLVPWEPVRPEEAGQCQGELGAWISWSSLGAWDHKSYLCLGKLADARVGQRPGFVVA